MLINLWIKKGTFSCSPGIPSYLYLSLFSIGVVPEFCPDNEKGMRLESAIVPAAVMPDRLIAMMAF
jgi:hypothetical protein